MEVFEIYGAECVYETDDAIIISADIFDENKPIPKSVVHDDSEVYKIGTEGTLIIYEWWAEKQGWI